MKMTFQEIRIIATGPCIANQLQDVNIICGRIWYIAAHSWKIYDFKIEVVPFTNPAETGKSSRFYEAFSAAETNKELQTDRVPLSTK
jgi:hypothetical protein